MERFAILQWVPMPNDVPFLLDQPLVPKANCTGIISHYVTYLAANSRQVVCAFHFDTNSMTFPQKIVMP